MLADDGVPECGTEGDAREGLAGAAAGSGEDAMATGVGAVGAVSGLRAI